MKFFVLMSLLFSTNIIANEWVLVEHDMERGESTETIQEILDKYPDQIDISPHQASDLEYLSFQYSLYKFKGEHSCDSEDDPRLRHETNDYNYCTNGNGDNGGFCFSTGSYMPFPMDPCEDIVDPGPIGEWRDHEKKISIGTTTEEIQEILNEYSDYIDLDLEAEKLSKITFNWLVLKFHGEHTCPSEDDERLFYNASTYEFCEKGGQFGNGFCVSSLAPMPMPYDPCQGN